MPPAGNFLLSYAVTSSAHRNIVPNSHTTDVVDYEAVRRGC